MATANMMRAPAATAALVWLLVATATCSLPGAAAAEDVDRPARKRNRSRSRSPRCQRLPHCSKHHNGWGLRWARLGGPLAVCCAAGAASAAHSHPRVPTTHFRQTAPSHLSDTPKRS